jgi:hypothetical protein
MVGDRQEIFAVNPVFKGPFHKTHLGRVAFEY